MGWTQSALPLWLAMISLSRQIGLLGDFHCVSGTGLGAQPKKIFESGWAAAGASVRASAAKPRIILRDFIKITPKTYVIAWRNNVPELALTQLRANGKIGVVSGGNFSYGESLYESFIAVF